jgi:hypothetical protein
MTRGKRTNNDLQSTTQKTKDWGTGTPKQTRGVMECYIWANIVTLEIKHPQQAWG